MKLRGLVVSNIPCISEIDAKTILNKSRISDVEFAINPFIGCQHGCIYCYAQFMKRYSGHLNDDWGSFVDVKVNAPIILENQLRKRRNPERPSVLFSSVTDPYQPTEEQYNITGRCISLLQNYDFPVSILTKSDLVLRDLNLLGMNKTNEIGMTIISLDEDIRRIFEPGAPPVKRRIDALREISEVGISTYAFVGPVLPFLGKPDVYDLLRELSELNLDYIYVDRLNFKSGNEALVTRAISENYPAESSKVLRALKVDEAYYTHFRDILEDIANSMGLALRIIF